MGVCRSTVLAGPLRLRVRPAVGSPRPLPRLSPSPLDRYLQSPGFSMFYPYTEPPLHEIHRSPAFHLFRHPLSRHERAMDTQVLGLAADNSGPGGPPPLALAADDGSSADESDDAGLPGSGGISHPLVPPRQTASVKASGGSKSMTATAASSAGAQQAAAAARGARAASHQQQQQQQQQQGSGSSHLLGVARRGRPFPTSLPPTTAEGSKRPASPPPPSAPAGTSRPDHHALSTRLANSSSPPPLRSVSRGQTVELVKAADSCPSCRSGREACPTDRSCKRCSTLALDCAPLAKTVEQRGQRRNASRINEHNDGDGEAVEDGNTPSKSTRGFSKVDVCPLSLPTACSLRPPGAQSSQPRPDD